MLALASTRRGAKSGAIFAALGEVCGLANVLVILLLCGAAVPASGAGVGCDGKWAQSPICLERQAAVQARARAEALLESLPNPAHPADSNAPPWNPAEVEAATADYETGLALYRDEYFGDAAAKFKAAAERLRAVEQAWRSSLAQHLAQAKAALEAGEFDAAAGQFNDVLGWSPNSEEAAAGLADAKQGITARQTLDQARQSFGRGNLEAAEKHLDSLPAGLLTDHAAELRREIAQTRRQDRLNRSMSRGFQQLDLDAWELAEAAFTEALRIDPTSVAAKDALEDLRRRRTDSELAASRTQLAQRIAAEQWREARGLLETMRKLDPNDAAIAAELARIGHLAETEARIDALLSEPPRLSAKGIRNRAKALIDTTIDPATYGENIIEKRNRLKQTLAVWTTPVEITIRSDNRTEVRIRPGRALGTFKEHRLAVFPGNYVLSGRRPGYREVRLSIAVPPGSDPQSVAVVCDERF